MARGSHSLRLLYRRVVGLPDRGRVYDAADLRALAEFLCAYADQAGGKGAPEAMTIMGLLAVDAGQPDFLRWLFYPRGRDNRFLDERDRSTITAFADYAERVRAGAADGLGPSGVVSKERYLARQGVEDVDAFAKRAYRFLGAARQDPRAPEIIRTLPAVFAPLGLDRALDGAAPRSPWWRVVAAAALVIAALAALALWPRAPRHDGNRSATSAFVADLGDGPRVVLGWRDGRWRIARPDGAVEWEAPGALRLPDVVEGGAAGDLTGDGVPELALYSSVPIEVFDRHQTGLWVFTRDGARWRLLERVRDFVGGADRASCAEVRARLATADELTVELHRARQRCPSRIGAIAIHDGGLHVAQLHYGRQYLRTTCDPSGCAPLTPTVTVDADVTSLAFIEPDGGGEALALGTGCWMRFGTRAYGVLLRAASGRERFTWTGGRTTVAAIDRRRLAVFAGSPCAGVSQQPLVAATEGPLEPGRQRTLAIAEVTAGGALRIVDEVDVGACCGETMKVATLRSRGVATHLALWFKEGDPDDTVERIQVYALTRPLAGQRPLELPGPRLLRGAQLAAVDVDGDGADELSVSRPRGGTEAWSIAGGAAARRRW